MEQADSIVYVNRDYHKDCMLERNRFFMDHSSFLLAVYNGERRGGTAATLRYARKIGRGIVILDPATGSISMEGIAPDLTWHQPGAGRADASRTDVRE